MPVMTPCIIADMLSLDAVSDGAEHLHPLLKGAEVNTGQTQDYPLCLSFVKSVGIDGQLKPLIHSCIDDASFTL
jgi:hypothetical protein